ncbi:MAG: bifunctional [glutamine synthetase] adenylyltransferase/[glutamine synthetase]-adenylyl-L-tyrosine phosphorylase [Alphaproteobacteria bacterium]|nr:bifunctional [glutamine synthetase] adenylyltransferase/[glutamine synthetase]-adenylyl-L-tyrosine phosphorylase [Alphaproteobacteria bacterium]
MFVETARTIPVTTDHDAARIGLERWLEGAERVADSGMAQVARDLAAHGTGSAVLGGLFSCSSYLTRLLLRDQTVATRILTAGPREVLDEVMAGLERLDPESMKTNDLMVALRTAKRHAALAIAIADTLGAWELEPVVVGLSDLADRSIGIAWRHALADQQRRGKLPRADSTDSLVGSGLICLAMGKLGARELNYSSDVDLVVFYDDESPLYEATEELQRAFVQATRLVVKLLEERTADGYVFRTDLRLRPDAGATPLAVSTSAAENYYESLGQNWERAAYIRARPVGCDMEAAAQFLDRMRPFIWRRHLDFAAIRDIHAIKRQIIAHRGGAEIAVEGHNLKLGRGGIREIEFFVQTQQLIWGGRDAHLREPRTADAMAALVEAGRVDPAVAPVLMEAYGYLRRVEHRLQMVADAQTHDMPETAEGMTRIAAFLGLDDVEDLRRDLLQRLTVVATHYGALFEEDAPLTADGDFAGSLVFTGVENDPETLRTLEKMGFTDPGAVSDRIRVWHHGRYRATRSERARQLLTDLGPSLLSAFAETAQPDDAFRRFDRFLEAVPAGVQLFSLILANPPLLRMIAEIMGMAPSLAAHLGANPSLFEGVLTHDVATSLPNADALAAELEEELKIEHSYEEILDTTRRWINDRRFQVGVQVLRGQIDPNRSGATMSDIVDAAIRCLLPRVEAEFARRHGRMPGADAPALAILAMGKLGGRELTAGSDLDLVFLHDSPQDTESDGEKPLGGNHYFIRLGQRLIAALTTKTAAGGLFEVDMRLRPSGNKGPLTSSLEGFRKYHAESSWTWEHMALTRARIVAGAPATQKRVEEAVREVLCQPRDVEALRAAVGDMRRRMAQSHAATSPWQLKHWRGGLVDAEFLVQYLQLRFAHEHPEVIEGNTALACERLAAIGALEAGDAKMLADAVRFYRGLQALLRLTVDDAFDPATAPKSLRERLAEVGGVEDFEALEARVEENGVRVRYLFDRHIGIDENEAEGVRDG